MPEFWRKVSILYSGGDDFAVCGSWDALIQLSREIQRLFHRFVEENLKDFPGAEGKTITMALAVASDQGSSPERMFEEAGRNLEFAKNADKDCIYLLGRILEWRQLSDASELKDTVTRMVAESRSSRQILFDLGSFYGKLSSIGRSPSLSPGGAEIHVEKIWRFHRRFNRVLGGARDRDTQKLRAHLISEIAARNAAQVKLRPAGQVALEWARLLTEV
jgi:CRISPR-associated protein Csm1